MSTQTHGQIINKLKAGNFKTLEKVSPSGSLQARRLSSSVMLYWRVTLNNKTERFRIGFYDSSAPPKSLQPTAKGFSVNAALRAAEELAQKHHANLEQGGHRGLVNAKTEADRLAKEAADEDARRAEAEKLMAEKFTLQNLLSHYCNYLEKLGRSSHKDARSIFRLHVNETNPKLASLPANQVTAEQVADMMRTLISAGKDRTANKLRSYLRAAYQVAKDSRTKASIPIEFKDFCITNNPAADTSPDASANRPDKNPLKVEELRQYWQAIKTIDGIRGNVLRLHLLTGGQRIAQFVRLKVKDITPTSITLYDGKGRPGQPARPHTLPLIPAISELLTNLRLTGEYALSTDGGKTHLAPTTLSEWATEAASNISNFEAKRIRSGIETLLASAKVSLDDRQKLQSHGNTGVQARHYDGYEYLNEKKKALTKLFNLLENKSKKVKKTVAI